MVFNPTDGKVKISDALTRGGDDNMILGILFGLLRRLFLFWRHARFFLVLLVAFLLSTHVYCS